MQMQFSDFGPGVQEVSPSELDKKRLSQVFNTALVHTRPEGGDESKELLRLMEEPAFAAILGCVQTHARNRGLSEVEAAKDIIRSFRRIDQIWTNYLIQEGIDRIKS